VVLRAVARPPLRPAARLVAVLRAVARPPARPAAERRAEVVLRDVVFLAVVRRAAVARPVVRRVVVLRAVARPPLRPAARLVAVLRAVARPPLRPAAARRVEVERVLVARPLVERLRVPVVERRVVPVERRVPPVRFLVPSSSTPITSSNMCLLLLRDLLDNLACLCVLALAGDVGLGQDSDQTPVFLCDGQPANLVLSHQAHRFIQVLFRIDGHEVA
jgi:hypothetical protein